MTRLGASTADSGACTMLYIAFAVAYSMCPFESFRQNMENWSCRHDSTVISIWDVLCATVWWLCNCINEMRNDFYILIQFCLYSIGCFLFFVRLWKLCLHGCFCCVHSVLCSFCVVFILCCVWMCCIIEFLRSVHQNRNRKSNFSPYVSLLFLL